MQAPKYNELRLETGRLSWEQITELIRAAQESLGLQADGKAGPKTLAAIGLDRLVDLEELSPLLIDSGWLEGEKTSLLPADRSWYYAKQEMAPIAVVAHYTSTNPGTAVSMAERRCRQWSRYAATVKPPKKARKTSWHVSIEADGQIIQMVPFNRGAWHARGTPTAVTLLGGSPNRRAIGIELVGKGKVFPEAQVNAAGRVWRALVREYGIRPELAMVHHSALDPGRKRDPGPVWRDLHQTRVLEYAYR